MNDIIYEDSYVELVDSEFEFMVKGTPSGYYARGQIIKHYDDKTCLVELFCNRVRYKVNKSIIKYIKEDK